MRLEGMAAKTKCAIFTRVSTADQNLLNQRHVLEQMAEQRGLLVAKVYEETISGTSKNRPELDRMLRDAHAGRFACLLIWALDRLGRTMVGNLQVVLDLDAKGVRIVSAQEGWLDLEGPVRSLLVAVFGWVAGQEKARLVERVRIGMDRARREGRHLGRPRVEVDVRRARELREGGLSVRAIAKEMRMSPATIHRALAASELAFQNPSSADPS